MLPVKLILAEAALETVPRELWRHPSVAKHALRLRRRPSNLLLDRSLHHRAMLRLPQAEKRGRPDLVHLALLEATSTPLYEYGQLQIYVHTTNNEVIRIGEGVRLPRSYHRFEGLVSQLFEKGRIEVDGLLLEVFHKPFSQLIVEMKPEPLIGLSRRGRSAGYDEVAARLLKGERPAFVIGGFPRGSFSTSVSKELVELYAVDALPLDAHVVIARLIYGVEKRADDLGLGWRP